MKKGILLQILLIVGCGKAADVTVRPQEPPSQVEDVITVPSEKYLPFNESPRAERLRIDWPEGTMAVWGSLGRDHQGRIWIGASVDSSVGAAASLLRYDPRTQETYNFGQPTRFLTTPPGLSQNKIHSQIVQAANGDFYFASMDESGELDDGSVLPTYGSYLWRLKGNATPETPWEKVAHVKEGIIAVAMGRSAVYFLGYFDHIVYRLDLKTQELTHTRVGASGGHCSRNLVVDGRDHVFVPRVRGGKASLVELDSNLDEIIAVPLTDYDVSPNADSHGIVSWTKFKNGHVALMTDGGRLLTIGNNQLTDHGLLHPAGRAYLSCLCTPDGEKTVVAIGRRLPSKADTPFEVIEFDVTTNSAKVKPISLPVPGAASNVLAYGSSVRDDDGAWYIAGAFTVPGHKGITPAVWRLK